MLERLSYPAVLYARSALVLGGLLAAGCGVDGVDGQIPSETRTELTFHVIPTDQLAKNGGEVHIGFVAYQDGDGDWLPMERQGDRYVAKIDAEHFGVALGCKSHTLAGTTLTAAFVSLHHASVRDGTELSDFSCVALGRPGRIAGTATGLPTPRSTFRIGTGEGSSNANVRADGFSVNVYATRTDVVAYFDGGSAATSKVLRLRDVDPMQGAPLTLDFSAATALDTFPVTAPSGALVSSHLRTATGQFLHLWSPQGQASYLTMPRALRQPGDLVSVGVTATETNGSREAFTILPEPGPVTLDLGSRLDVAAPALTGGPAARATFFVDPNPDTLPLVDFQVSTSARAGSALSWQSANVSRAWLESSGSPRYEMPDLRAISGWAAEMALPSGTPVRWQVVRTETSSKTAVSGQRTRIATAFGTLAN